MELDVATRGKHHLATEPSCNLWTLASSVSILSVFKSRALYPLTVRAANTSHIFQVNHLGNFMSLYFIFFSTLNQARRFRALKQHTTFMPSFRNLKMHH